MKIVESIKKKSHQEGTEIRKQSKRTKMLQNYELKPKKEPIDTSKKRKFQTDIELNQKPRKIPKKKKKAEVEDKLDKLIEQYRLKFTQRGLDKGKDAGTSSGRKEDGLSSHRHGLGFILCMCTSASVTYLVNSVHFLFN